MDSTSTKLIADAWIALHYAQDGSAEHRSNFWAYERMGNLCTVDPEACWQIIHAIRNKDDSELILSNLAAGPMEDLLANHGERFIERIEDLAQRDEKFRKLLGAVWRNEISESVWKRLSGVAGSSW